MRMGYQSVVRISRKCRRDGLHYFHYLVELFLWSLAPFCFGRCCFFFFFISLLWSSFTSGHKRLLFRQVNLCVFLRKENMGMPQTVNNFIRIKIRQRENGKHGKENQIAWKRAKAEFFNVRTIFKLKSIQSELIGKKNAELFLCCRSVFGSDFLLLSNCTTLVFLIILLKMWNNKNVIKDKKIVKLLQSYHQNNILCSRSHAHWFSSLSYLRLNRFVSHSLFIFLLFVKHEQNTHCINHSWGWKEKRNEFFLFRFTSIYFQQLLVYFQLYVGFFFLR